MLIFDKKLSEIHSLSSALNIVSGDIVQFVGCGGKTSLINYLANEVSTKNPKNNSAIITTTKRLLPDNCNFILKNNEQLNIANDFYGCIEAGVIAKDNKYCWLGDKNYSALKKWTDVILVEADGSKYMPIKACADHEPVYLKDACKTVVVMGMSAYQKRLTDVCFRYEIFLSDLKDKIDKCLDVNHKQSLLNVYNSEFVTKETYKYLIDTYYLQGANNNITVVLNQADNECLQKAAQDILKSLEVDGLITSFC